MEPSRFSTLRKLPLLAAMLVWAFAVIASAAPASATTGQTSITLVGGVSTVVQHDDTSWDSTKTLKTPISPDPVTNSGTVTWAVTVKKTAVSGKTIEADGYLTVKNTGANPASIGNIVVSLQQFKKSCKGTNNKTYTNIWVSQAADMADADNGNGASIDNIVASASQEVVPVNQGVCGAKNYTTVLPKGTFIKTGGSGTLEFDSAGNTLFSEPTNVIPAGQSVTFAYQATFDNTFLGLKPGVQIRTETIVSFGNAGARGGSGASAPGFEIDGNDGYNASEDGAYVRSVPTRTSLTVPATCIHCNQLVTLTDTPDDITTDLAGNVTIVPNTFSFSYDGADAGVSQLTDGSGNTYFVLDGSQIATGTTESFTVSVGYNVADCLSGTIFNTANLDTNQYDLVLAGLNSALTPTFPYSWDVDGDLLLQIGTDGLGNPINIVICKGLDQDPGDTETITSTDPTCGVPINPPPPPGNFCTFLQSQWVHTPGDATLAALMGILPSETIGTGGTFDATWDSAADIEAYLPAGGINGALSANLLDPTSTSAGHFGGEVLALQLNVDLGNSGLTLNSNTVDHFGALLICGTGTQFDGHTVADLLAAANTAVGGGSLPADCTGLSTCTFNNLDALLQHVNVSFQQCHETGFGLHHLFVGSCPP